MAFPPLFSGDKTVKFRVIAARPPPWTMMVRVRFPIGAGLGFQEYTHTEKKGREREERESLAFEMNQKALPRRCLKTLLVYHFKFASRFLFVASRLLLSSPFFKTFIIFLFFFHIFEFNSFFFFHWFFVYIVKLSACIFQNFHWNNSACCISGRSHLLFHCRIYPCSSPIIHFFRLDQTTLTIFFMLKLTQPPPHLQRRQ